MTHYSTCTNCAVDRSSCQRLANVRAALRGQHVYSLKFKCAERRPMFAEGQRVQFDWMLWENDGYDSEALPLVFKGTVLAERGTKFVVQVDRGADASGKGIQAPDVFRKNDQLLIKVRPANMRPIGEPAREVCTACYWVEGASEVRCQKLADWAPVGCTALSKAKEG